MNGDDVNSVHYVYDALSRLVRCRSKELSGGRLERLAQAAIHPHRHIAVDGGTPHDARDRHGAEVVPGPAG